MAESAPGQVKEHIRPDIVLFVNGMPLVVIEAKEANEFTSIPIDEAVEQLFRYRYAVWYRYAVLS